MTFPNRALVTAPVARDLSAEHPNTARVPGATNGTLQGWDTLDQDFWTLDATVTVYPALATIPLPAKKLLIQVKRYDDVGGTINGRWMRFADCTALDFIAITNAGVPSVKAATALVAGDRPSEWDLLHRWFGNVMETLGAP